MYMWEAYNARTIPGMMVTISEFKYENESNDEHNTFPGTIEIHKSLLLS